MKTESFLTSAKNPKRSMADIKTEIEKFIENAISNKNYPLLDILWTFSYSIQQTSQSVFKYPNPKSDYGCFYLHKNKKVYKKIQRQACTMGQYC